MIVRILFLIGIIILILKLVLNSVATPEEKRKLVLNKMVTDYNETNKLYNYLKARLGIDFALVNRKDIALYSKLNKVEKCLDSANFMLSIYRQQGATISHHESLQAFTKQIICAKTILKEMVCIWEIERNKFKNK